MKIQGYKLHAPLLLLLHFFLFSGCSWIFGIVNPAVKHPAKISLDGTWRVAVQSGDVRAVDMSGIDDTNWQRISVPSNWYLQGIETSGGHYWYRKRFRVDSGVKKKVVRLVFDAVDYIADVWLNGHYLGAHEGYFSPFSFIVSDQILYDGENVLTVLVKSPLEDVDGVWSLRKEQIKGVLNHHDTRPGGAWSPRGQEKNSGGIWGSVYLEVSDSVVIEKIKITPVVTPGGDCAQAEIDMVVLCPSGNDMEQCGDIDLTLLLEPHNFKARPPRSSSKTMTVQLKPGRNDIHDTVDIENPRLWWPWELGDPNLYGLKASLTRDGAILSESREIFGFRSISCNTDDMVWRINGKRLFLKGTNYIGSPWLSEMDREKYRRDLRLMKDAYINAIRVHAHIAGKAFYRLCDEMGLLVWQDFPLQWGYSDSDRFIREAKKQAEEMIALLFNHPSIFLWCGHNEPPWDASWMKYKYPDYDPDQNRVLDDELYGLMVSLDDSRFVQKFSATSEHPWLGWYSGSWLDYSKSTSQQLISEFGAQALPDLSTLETIFEKKDLWPQTEEQFNLWQYHNFQPRETFEIAGVSRGENIGAFISNTQTYQAMLIKHAAESYRRQRFAPVTGIFQFMFVETWPSMNWGIVDYLRIPKPGYRALQTAYQPILPSIEFDRIAWKKGSSVKLGLWLINDHQKAMSDLDLGLMLKKKDGHTVFTGNIAADVGADSRQFLGVLSWPWLRKGIYCLELVLFDKHKKELATNSYEFAVDMPEKYFGF